MFGAHQGTGQGTGSEVYKLDPKVSEEWEKVGTLAIDAYGFPLVVPFVKDFDPSKQAQNPP